MKPQRQGASVPPSWQQAGPGRWEGVVNGRRVTVLQHLSGDDGFRVAILEGRRAGESVHADTLKEAKAKAERLAR